MIVRIMTKILKIKIMKIIVMCINVEDDDSESVEGDDSNVY